MVSRKPVERTERRDMVADAGVGAALGYSRPGSYEELRAVLSSGTARLPKKLRQVAIHLWQHPTAVALGTVTSVAGEAGVQPSTLVRFAQAFGYSGFSDLQEVFKAHLTGGGQSRDRWESASSSEAARLVDGFIGSSTAALAGVRDRLDLTQFEMMSETLAAADLIYIIGSKRAFSLVSYVSLALANLGVRNLALDNVGSTAFELLRCAATSDAVLAISFTPYNSITPELAASAAQRGVPIVSLTDSAFSPLVPVSRAYVEVIEEGFSGFKSLSATLAVAMALVLRVEQRRSEATASGPDGSSPPSRPRSRGPGSRAPNDGREPPLRFSGGS
jgi:DNA-binding MurR/RpiR family transcriptional regulator